MPPASLHGLKPTWLANLTREWIIFQNAGRNGLEKGAFQFQGKGGELRVTRNPQFASFSPGH
jgi:hypothetical protein